MTGISSIHGWPLVQQFLNFYGDLVYGVCPIKMHHYFKDNKNVFSCNLEDFDALQRIFELSNPVAIVHAGGVCDLDLCQDCPDFAYKVNVVGAQNIRKLAMDKYVLYVRGNPH